MGTNYYARINVCEHCGCSKQTLHIGKYSHGWTFSFRGYKCSHNDLQIESYKDWLKLLSEEKVIIEDEYGDSITLDELKTIVEEAKGAMYNHYDYIILDKTCDTDYLRNNWKDDEGHSFCDWEFC